MIRVNVSLANATVTETETLTAGRVGLECGFTFSSEWSDLLKVAVFESAETIEVALGRASVAVVPPECMATAGYNLRVGVYGLSPANAVVIPTVWAKAGKIKDSAAPDDESFAPATPELVAQIIDASQTALEIAQGVAEQAANGDFDGTDGVSPTASVAQSGSSAVFTVTDANGTTTATLTSGTDGVSPSVQVSEITHGHKVTVTDADGSTNFDVLDGKSAYELAVEGGYVGTEEDFESDLNNFKTYASTASSAASTATSAKNDAVSAKDDAVTAKNAAISAKDDAISAKDDAVTAKNTAVSAKDTAVSKASEASSSATSASGSASTATTKAGEAATSATTASTKAGEAATSATSAATAKSGADASALVAEGWAKGTQNGTAVESGTYFHDNAKYYKEQAEAVAQSIPEDYTELSQAVSNIESKMPVVNTEVDPNSYSTEQTLISATTGKWSGNASNRSWFIPVTPDDADKITIEAAEAAVARVALLKDDSHTAGTYPNYATGSELTTIAAGESLILSVPSDTHYLWVFKIGSAEILSTPESIEFKKYLNVPVVDDSLSVSGAAADAKATGDAVSKIGDITTVSFTKTGNNNAVKNFSYPLEANEQILVRWTSEEEYSDNAGLSLYTRATSDGSNIETILSNAKLNVWYTVAPTQSCNYLRVSATRSGTITVIRVNTIYGNLTVNNRDIAQLKENVPYEPFVRFSFGHEMYDPSEIFSVGGEMGAISGWSSKADALEKVHAAFDGLCTDFSSYVSRVDDLYKESAGDEALFDILAPSYVTAGVTQGDTVTLDIGTDTDGNQVTYNYIYESSTDPYEVRLYKFHDTNNALHTNSKDIPKKKLLIVGGVHGNEFCAPIDLYVFAKQLCTDYSNPDILKLRSSFDVYIIPYLNGFGCQYQWANSGTTVTGTRCNGHLVDINRNCDTYGWIGASGTAEQITANFESQISNLATDVFAGPSAGSEFEAELLKEIVLWLKPDVFIDHHNNSGNSPIYSTSPDDVAGMLIYQAINDCAYAYMHNYSEYFGTAYNLFLGSDVSPVTKTAGNGHTSGMAYENGVKLSAVNEMNESIAFLNGVYDSGTKEATKYSSDVFAVSEYTLTSIMLHFCQYAMEH